MPFAWAGSQRNPIRANPVKSIDVFMTATKVSVYIPAAIFPKNASCSAGLRMCDFLAVRCVMLPGRILAHRAWRARNHPER